MSVDAYFSKMEPAFHELAEWAGIQVVTKQAGEPWFNYTSFQGIGGAFPLMVSLGSVFVYLALVYYIWPLMKPERSPAVGLAETWRKTHNIELFCFSTFCCTVTFAYLVEDGQLTWTGFDTEALTCKTAPAWLQYLNFFFVISKVWEWTDTMFLVFLSPRAKSFLHVYHHATTFWLFLLVANLPGPLKLGMLLNGGVHALMYAHYAWPFPKRLVPFITMAQIAQLGYVTYNWTITPSTCGARFADFPTEYPGEFATPYAFVPVYIVFFVHFFAKRFLGIGAKKKPVVSGYQPGRK